MRDSQCSRCHGIIPGEDFDRGKAVRYAGSDYCRRCARLVMGLTGGDTTKTIREILGDGKRGDDVADGGAEGAIASPPARKKRPASSGTLPVVRGPRAAAAGHGHPRQPPHGMERTLVFLVGALVVVLAVAGILILAFRRGQDGTRGTPEEEATLRISTRQDEAEAALERTRKARETYDAVQEYVKCNPDSFREIRAKLKEILPVVEGTEFEGLVNQGLERYESLLKLGEASELKAMGEKFEELIFHGQYEEAEELCRANIGQFLEDARNRDVERMLEEASEFRENRDAWSRQPEFYCKFVGEDIDKNVEIAFEGCEHTNVQSGDMYHLKFLNDRGSFLVVRFDVRRPPRRAVLRLKHQSSWGGSKEASYSAVDVFFNGEALARALDPGLGSQLTHGWDVTARLRMGENSVRIETAGAKSHYWLYTLGVFFEEE